MTLDEAIKHCEEKADELNKEVLKQANLCNAREMAECQECAREHEQLAEWLKDYRRLLGERPHGEWIIVKDERYGDNVKCPFCEKELAGTDLNFCCKCGAKLIGSEKMNGGAEK